MNAPFVPVIHSVEAPGGAPQRADEADTLTTASSVTAALERLGCETGLYYTGLDLGSLRELAARKPLAVFNLVEAIGGDDALAFLPCLVLDRLGVPYTGAGGAAQYAIRSKLQAKRLLRDRGLPTPDWWVAGEEIPAARTVIVKSDDQHASRGMDGDSILRGRRAQAAIAEREQRYGGRFFAEAFVTGREFNVAVLGSPSGPRVLPIPEICFDDLPPGRPHIVDWEAKWDTDAPAYYQTERRFGLERREPRLAKKLAGLALDCWRGFDMNGYARVDFRVDGRGRPTILEINANPCLAPDAGFAASAAEAGLSFDELIREILAESAVFRPSAGAATQSASPRRRGAVRAASPGEVGWRCEVEPGDGERVQQLVKNTGMFTAEEAAIALELVQQRLERGPASGYEFVLAEQDGTLLGYACYGANTTTDDGFELYWIAVQPRCQGQGLGRRILQRVEEATAQAGGRMLWAETSSTAPYAPTRAFYRKNGFTEAARLKDFYRPGDSKVILSKRIPVSESGQRKSA